MDSKDKQKRIKFNVQLPSLALKRFIDKALVDDEFFDLALENPVSALKESGVRMNSTTISPADLASFFSALAGVKELVKNKKLKDITFEQIFGQSAEIVGSTILSETERGVFTQFNRNAHIDKEICSSSKTSFQTLRDIDKGILAQSQIQTQTRLLQQLQARIQTKIEMDLVGSTEQSRETSTGVTFHFDHNRGIGSSTSSSIDTYRDKNFGGISLIEELFSGPLINPVDLVNLATQLSTFVKIVEKNEQI